MYVSAPLFTASPMPLFVVLDRVPKVWLAHNTNQWCRMPAKAGLAEPGLRLEQGRRSGGRAERGFQGRVCRPFSARSLLLYCSTQPTRRISTG